LRFEGMRMSDIQGLEAALSRFESAIGKVEEAMARARQEVA